MPHDTGPTRAFKGRSRVKAQAAGRSPKCRRCGYDLSGLSQGGRCPECGTAIPILSRRVLSDNLTLAPTGYLRWLAVGALASVLGGVGGMLTAFSTLQEHSPRWVVPIACFILWEIGVWIVTRPRESSVDTRTDFRAFGRRTRWAARLTQWGWAFGLAGLWSAKQLELTAIATAAVPDEALINACLWAGWACLGLALLGLIAVCLQFAALAEWAGNEWTGEWMRGASLGMVLAPPMIVAAILAGPEAFVVVIIGVLGGVILLACGGLLALGLIQVAAMSLWALRASSIAMARDTRLAESAQRDAEAFVERSRHVGEADPLDARSRAQRGPVRHTDLSPLDVEPDRKVGKRTIRYERPGE